MDPSPDNLYNLATLYDQGGDLRAAIGTSTAEYWSGEAQGSPYQARAKARMEQIAVMIFTPTPPP